MNRKGWSLRYYTGGTFSPKCTSDGLDSCMAPAFWQTLISITEVRKRYCSGIDPYKSKPMDQKFQLFCLATRHSQWSRDYRDLKFDKGTIYIVYFLENMGNLLKSMIKLYICDNKLRSCAQFAPQDKCASWC